MNRLFLAAASSLSASALLCGAVQADERASFACINKYKVIGLPHVAMWRLLKLVPVGSSVARQTAG